MYKSCNLHKTDAFQFTYLLLQKQLLANFFILLPTFLSVSSEKEVQNQLFAGATLLDILLSSAMTFIDLSVASASKYMLGPLL